MMPVPRPSATLPPTGRGWKASGARRKLEVISSGRPESRSVLDRRERFLGLATLLHVILSPWPPRWLPGATCSAISTPVP
jgi:predicted lysophospholipase L1 biosynthesis ABC-type transport system permease subunit